MTKSKKFDITVSGNCIGGRQGYAYILNSMQMPVIDVDLDKEQEYTTYHTYGKVKALWSRNYTQYGMVAELALNTEGGKEKWELTQGGCCLKASFGYSDLRELMSEANLPRVKSGEWVALASHSDNNHIGFVRLFKVGRVDIHCQTVAELEPLTDEEMNTVLMSAETWCR